MGNRQSRTRHASSQEEEPLRNERQGDGGDQMTSDQPSPDHATMDNFELFQNYVFPFENVVFEGGGNKGLAYCGAVRVLEETGIWNRIRRLGGSSSGAMMAALLCVGYNSLQVEKFFSREPEKLFLDHSCGYLSLLPNLLRTYGWNPGQRLLHWFGSKLKEATGKADVTFSEVYQMFGRELCVVVTNLNQQCTEYCHPKSTPDMPVRIAVRMAMGIPGLVKPVKYKLGDQENIYIDGGVMCNFPIHCYDGWWLSMESADAFVKRIDPLTQFNRRLDEDDRFGTYNNKSIGFLVYAECERDLFQEVLDNRTSSNANVSIPNTTLSRNYQAKREGVNDVVDKHKELTKAVDKLLQALRSHKSEQNRTITKKDLHNALSKVRSLCKEESLCEEDLKVLFGDKVSPEDIFLQIEPASSDQITYPELVGYLERKGLHLQAQYLDHRRTEISSLMDYVLAVHTSLHSNARLAHLKKRDAERTVGINTHYIQTADCRLGDEDKNFLVQQGAAAARSFLEYYISQRMPALDGEARKSFCRDDLSYYIDDEGSEIIDERDYMENFIKGVL